MHYGDYMKKEKLRNVTIWISVLLFIWGCASSKGVKQETQGSKAVTETVMPSQSETVIGETTPPDTQVESMLPKSLDKIEVSDSMNVTTVTIKGNTFLTYSSVKPMPLGLVLYFPETALRTEENELTAVNSIIESVKAFEIIEGGPSKVVISLKQDTPHKIYQEGNEISVLFEKGDAEDGVNETAENVFSEENEVLEADNNIAQIDTPIDGTLVANETALALEEDDTFADESDAAIVEGSEGVPEQSIMIAETQKEESATATKGSMLKKVNAESTYDNVTINVIADGMIEDYKTFTLDDPARIVFDLYNIKSAYKRQQILDIESEWIKKVRYFTYPEYTRVVLETEKQYLSSFSSKPTADGIVIVVGMNIPEKMAQTDTQNVTADNKEPYQLDAESFSEAPLMAEETVVEEAMGTPLTLGMGGEADETDMPDNEIDTVAKPEFDSDSAANEEVVVESTVQSDASQVIVDEPEFDSGSATDEEVVMESTVQSDASQAIVDEPEIKIDNAYTRPARVNQTDFTGKENGRSTIIIGTDRPVEYDLVRFKDRGLQLKLIDTSIHRHRQRPIITTRFESAVDRITPVQTLEMGNNSMVIIELREDVPYSVEKLDNQILIHFEASSVPPKPFDESAFPTWKQILEQAMVEAPVVTPEIPVEQPLLETISPPEMVDEAAMEEPKESIEQVEQMEKSKAFEAQESGLIPRGSGEEAAAKEDKVVSSASKFYTGEKISLDFFNTDIKNVLRILRDVSGKNFAIDKDVKGSVTLSLIKPVPWDQALDLILKMNQLSSIMEGDIIRITTNATRLREDEQRSKTIKAEQMVAAEKIALEPLVTEYISISYANASTDVVPHIQKILTSDRGSVSVDARNNQIILTDIADKVVKAKEIVRQIDKVTPQVMIEARIVEVSETFSRDIGTEWGSGSYDANGGRYYPLNGHSLAWDVAMNHPAPSTGTIGLNFSRLIGTPFSIDAKLMASETQGESKIISAPRVVTLDNRTASITQGVEVPYQQSDGNGNTTTQFKNVDLTLNVTPHVTPDNRISLQLDITKNDVLSGSGSVPSLATNKTKTELLVNDNDTIVIGGIVKSNRRSSESRFPIVGKIPIVGWLFKSKNRAIEKTELLIFITPTIVQLEEHSNN